MKPKEKTDLPISAFIVLSLLAEGQAHGYEIEKLVWNRGFRFWADLGKSSIYNSLKLLENADLAKSEIESGGGPLRKVFSITKKGRQRLESQSISILSEPAHPRTEIDLGIYALPFLSPKDAYQAITQGLAHLSERKFFLEERLKWCEEHSLAIPALSFERPLLVLEAEIQWLKRLQSKLKTKAFKNQSEWQEYIYKEPPHAQSNDKN